MVDKRDNKRMDMESQYVTVVTVVYNCADKIEETIKSIVSQTYPNIEYIIIDGGSTDGTIDIIKKYEKGISCWISEPDKGIYDAMNKGIDKSTGDWICFINAGDGFYNSDVINNIKEYFKDPLIDVIYGDSIVCYENQKKRLIKAGKIVENLWKGPIFRHGAMFVRTPLHKKYKFRLDPSYRICADFDLIYHLFIDRRKFSYIDKPVMYYEQEGISSNRIRCAKDNKMVVLSYTSNLRYILWHNVFILKAYIISYIITPFFRLISINL